MKKSNNFINILIVIVACFIIGITMVKIFYKSNPTSNDNETIYVDNEENQIDNDSNTINNSRGSSFTKPELKPIGNENEDFYLVVEATFKITGKGTVIAGNILRGTVKVGDIVQTVGVGKEPKTGVVKEINIKRESVSIAKVDEELPEVQLILGNVNDNDVVRGQVVAKPNTVKSYKKFDASIYAFTPEDTGYEKPFPIKSDDVYQYYFRNADYYGKLKFKENIKILNQGQNANVTVSFDTDCVMETGEEFFIRSGGHILGRGKVTKVYK